MPKQQLDEISVGEILGEGDDRADTRGVRSLVLSFVRQSPEGVTAQMVSKAAKVSLSWTKQVLEELTHQREIYSRVVPGLKSTMYYPNGRLIHKYLQEAREFGPQIFRVSVHEGRRTPRVQIQERRYTLLEGEKVEGAIFVDLDNLEPLLSFIRELAARLDQIKETEKLAKEK